VFGRAHGRRRRVNPTPSRPDRVSRRVPVRLDGSA
jgi:hypothetical protein